MPMESAQLCFSWKVIPITLEMGMVTWRDDVIARISRSNAVAVPSDRSTIAFKTLRSSRNVPIPPLSARSAWRRSYSGSLRTELPDLSREVTDGRR
jgi:hypothetical protein